MAVYRDTEEVAMTDIESRLRKFFNRLLSKANDLKESDQAKKAACRIHDMR
jgi:hypothetical protein